MTNQDKEMLEEVKNLVFDLADGLTASINLNRKLIEVLEDTIATLTSEAFEAETNLDRTVEELEGIFTALGEKLDSKELTEYDIYNGIDY